MSRRPAMRAVSSHGAARDDLTDQELRAHLKAIKYIVDSQIQELSLLSAPGKWGTKPETRKQIKALGVHLAGIEETTRLRARTVAEITAYKKNHLNQKEANHG